MAGPLYHYMEGKAQENFRIKRLLSAVVYARYMPSQRYIDHAKIYKRWNVTAVLSSPYCKPNKKTMYDLALVKHYANVIDCDVLAYDNLNMYSEGTIDIFFISGESFKPLDMAEELLRSTHYNFYQDSYHRENEEQVIRRVTKVQDHPLEIPDLKHNMSV